MKAWAGVWMLRSPTNTQAALVSEQITAQVMVNLLHGLTVVAGFPRRPDQRNSLFFFVVSQNITKICFVCSYKDEPSDLRCQVLIAGLGKRNLQVSELNSDNDALPSPFPRLRTWL